MRLNSITIKTSNSKTYLCELGIEFPTDKSPYNTNSESQHRHPYTGIYDILFGNMRYKDINFGEIGIANNQSMLCWRKYFNKAKLWGWEFDQNKINKAINDNLNNTTYIKMNVQSKKSIIDGFNKSNVLFDIIIDDSTHIFDDQIRIATTAYKYLKPGGYLIIEDVFRNCDEHSYRLKMNNYAKYYESMTFITAEHKYRSSPGWDNDKLLILSRNNEYIQYHSTNLS